VTLRKLFKELGMVALVCNPSYIGSGDGMMLVQGQLEQKMLAKPYLKK
jgi:hypothetical protein